MPKSIKVTVYDPETGETETAEIPSGSYLLFCTEPAYLSSLTAYGNGTHQITVRGVTNPMAGLGLGERR